MIRKLLTPVLVIAAAGGVYGYIEHADPPAPQVAQAAITRGDVIESVVSTGTIDALRTVQVGSQVSGTVSEVDADFNSLVKKDQVIARLDPALLQVQVDIQQAAVDRQQTEIQNQQTQLDNADLNLKRARDLAGKQLISQQDLEQAVLTDEADRAALNSAKKMLVQAEASLNQARLNVSYCTIRAPIDGVVLQRLVDPGQTVQSSTNTPQFFVLATELDHLKLTAAVDESEIGKIRPGQRVGFTVDAYRGQTFHGTVDSVRLNSVTTQNVVTYQTIVDVLNPDLRLRPGMTASLQIVVAEAHDVARVPSTALRFRPSAEMYTALGLTPPAAEITRLASSAGAGGPDASSAGTAETRGARRGQRGGTAGANGAPPTAPTVNVAKADKIDELFTPFQEPPSRGRVWTWDAATKRLASVDVQIGITDGQQSVLLSGSLQPGQSVVTNVLLPAPAKPMGPTAPNPLMGPQRGGYRRF